MTFALHRRMPSRPTLVPDERDVALSGTGTHAGASRWSRSEGVFFSMSRSRASAGLTLIEVMVVIAIAATLLGAVVVSVSALTGGARARRWASSERRCERSTTRRH